MKTSNPNQTTNDRLFKTQLRTFHMDTCYVKNKLGDTINGIVGLC